jgi:uncharacterized SAM-binding protein YcdF (DUF218 family)
MTALRRLALALLLLIAASAAVVTASALWLAGASPPGPATVIIVLGGEMNDDNTLAPDTSGRVEAGVALFDDGLAPRIHFTGGVARRSRPGAGTQMQALAIALGVPPQATSAESASRSTLQNALMSRPVLGPLADGPVVLVSDGYHLLRARASFRWAGYGPVGLAAASALGAPPPAEQVGHVARETLAWWFNLARVGAWEAAALVRGPDAVPIDFLR